MAKGSELRIAFIRPHLGIGARAERLVVDAALGLQSLGHSVDIYTSHHDPNHCFDETRDALPHRKTARPSCNSTATSIHTGKASYHVCTCKAAAPHNAPHAHPGKTDGDSGHIGFKRSKLQRITVTLPPPQRNRQMYGYFISQKWICETALSFLAEVHPDLPAIKVRTRLQLHKNLRYFYAGYGSGNSTSRTAANLTIIVGAPLRSRLMNSPSSWAESRSGG
ncbi:hypothetical protein DFH29DRAFT_1006158 [Suillus ampliporus]|nr:hypothetical protein DFH29DRAFT_1006158 [Suillus ampliporus]